MTHVTLSLAKRGVFRGPLLGRNFSEFLDSMKQTGPKESTHYMGLPEYVQVLHLHRTLKQVGRLKRPAQQKEKIRKTIQASVIYTRFQLKNLSHCIGLPKRMVVLHLQRTLEQLDLSFKMRCNTQGVLLSRLASQNM